MMRQNRHNYNCLLGLAIGDSMGLPMEGLSRAKIKKLGWMKEPRQRFIFRKGMVSDDTEHGMMTLNALIRSNGAVKKFRGSLRWRLRWWFIGLPAGVGMATAKSCLKMWLGLKNSGVYSAGNGPAMRSVIIGSYFSDDSELRRAYVKVSTEVTHTDPKALVGANVVAEIAAMFAQSDDVSQGGVENIVVEEGLMKKGGEGWRDRCEKGVSGYMMNTVPALLKVGRDNSWDYEKSVSEMISKGGDTDTTAAILGALCSLRHGGVPEIWTNDLVEFPRSLSAMKKLALEENASCAFWFPLAVILRNILFLVIVLGHGFRRLLDVRLWFIK